MDKPKLLSLVIMTINSLLKFVRWETMDLSARRVVQPDTVKYTQAASLVQGNVTVDVKMDGLVLIVVKLR
jgi:hypothetical protein